MLMTFPMSVLTLWRATPLPTSGHQTLATGEKLKKTEPKINPCMLNKRSQDFGTEPCEGLLNNTQHEHPALGLYNRTLT
jgi:hypothetical protein